MKHINNYNRPRAHGEIEEFLQRHSQTAFERYLEVDQLRKKHPELSIREAFTRIYPNDIHTVKYLAAIAMINARLKEGETIEDLQRLYPPEIEQTLVSAQVEEQRSATASKLRGIRLGDKTPIINIESANIVEAKQAQQQDNEDFDKANDEFVDGINKYN
jgi:hypothetical protein